MSDLNPSPQIGRSIPRLEARAKVTGRTEYVHHLRLPGMLHGKIFRSTMPHALIKKIDVSAAAALEGVYRVVTIADIKTVIPHPYYGPSMTSPCWPMARCASPVSLWPWCWPMIARSRKKRSAL